MAKATKAAKFLLLLTLTTLLIAPDWQASGFGQGGWPGNMRDNMEPNLPQVYVEIDKTMGNDVGGGPPIMALNISKALNELWD